MLLINFFTHTMEERKIDAISQAHNEQQTGKRGKQVQFSYNAFNALAQLTPEDTVPGATPTNKCDDVQEEDPKEQDHRPSEGSILNNGLNGVKPKQSLQNGGSSFQGVSLPSDSTEVDKEGIKTLNQTSNIPAESRTDAKTLKESLMVSSSQEDNPAYTPNRIGSTGLVESKFYNYDEEGNATDSDIDPQQEDKQKAKFG